MTVARLFCGVWEAGEEAFFSGADAAEMEARVVCPFFIGFRKRVIICEGAAEGCRNYSCFEREEGRREFMRSACSAGEFNTCVIAMANFLKYGDEGWLFRKPDAATMRNAVERREESGK